MESSSKSLELEPPSAILETESENFHNYFIRYKIGVGGFGTVYRGINKKTGADVALKKISFEDSVSNNILREITLLQQCEHPNIIHFWEVCHGKQENVLYLIFEYIDQDLDIYMQKHPNGFTDFQIIQLTLDMLSGTDYLHTNKVIHRDIKPLNLLVTLDGHIKLADFGLTRYYDSKMKLSPVVVTLWYRAPEILLHLAYSTPIDIWSIGCIIVELYTFSPMFYSLSEIELLNKIFSILGKPSEEDWPTEKVCIELDSIQVEPPAKLNELYPKMSEVVLDLVMKMLVFNPKKRITALEATTYIYKACGKDVKDL